MTTTNVSPAIRSLIAEVATGPVEFAHHQFLVFPAGSREVTIFHTDGKFEYAYTGRNGEFFAQHSTIKGLRRAVAS